MDKTLVLVVQMNNTAVDERDVKFMTASGHTVNNHKR